MTLTDPEWRIKSRPCPFYQHGRCLFADSCNFLHTVSVKPLSVVTMIDSPTILDQPEPRKYPAPPVVTVESPRSTSSPRSPRFSGLLHALKDVIGEDLEDAPSNFSEEADLFSAFTHAPQESNTIVPDGTTTSDFSENEIAEEVLEVFTEIVIDDEYSAGQKRPLNQGHYTPDNVDDDDGGDLPDSSDDERTIRVSVRSPRFDATPAVPDQSPTGQSHSHAKSGSTSSQRPSRPLIQRPLRLQLESAASTDFKLADKGGEAVIDSGYAESWQPPSPLAISPPRTPVRNSTLDLLASPFGSPPTVRILSQISLLRRLGFTAAVDKDQDAISDISLDCPADCGSPRHSASLSCCQLSVNSGNASPETTSGPPNGRNRPSIGSAKFPELSSCTQGACEDAFRSAGSPLPPSDSLDGDLRRIDANTSPTAQIGDLTSNSCTLHLDDDVSNSTSIQLAYLGCRTLSESGNNTHETSYEEHSDNISLPREQDHEYGQINSQEPPLLNNSPSRERNIPPPSDSMDRKSKASAVKPPARSSSLPLSSTRPQNCNHSSSRHFRHSIRSSASSVTTETSRRVPLGWKKSTARSRSSEPAMSSRSQRGATNTPNEFVIDGKMFDRVGTELVSPTFCPSCGCAPLKLPPVLSPDYKSSTFPPHMSSGFSTASHNRSNSSSSSSVSLPSSVSSAKSTSSNFLLSPTRIINIPQQPVNSIHPDVSIPSPLSTFSLDLKNFEEPASTAPYPYSYSGPPHDSGDPATLGNFRFPKKRSDSSLYRIDENEDSRLGDQPSTRYPYSIPTPTRTSSSTSRRSSPLQPPSHAIATPRPTLFFAIASDDVNEVRKVLEGGEAGPNEAVGPQSTLEFVLTNEQLVHKTEMTKLLLAYGANPAVVRNQHSACSSSVGAVHHEKRPNLRVSLLNMVDPATRYYLEKADSTETQRTSALMRRSSFRPVTRVRYDIIGQDRPLEQLFKILSIHTRQLSATPIVVVLTGPSGHGKSLLARKFGSVLDVPTHIVNMTTLKSTHDLWQSYSMNPHNETPAKRTLAEFLMNNEGKRCVVVLDEIDKTVDEKALWSLLMPWEMGRCSINAGSRHIDVRNVVWLGTSNVGHDIVLEYQNARLHPQSPISQEEYSELTGMLRPKLSDHLGPSVLSRVSAVLPFVPFTPEERKVICYEAMYTLGGNAVRDLPPQVISKVVENALRDYSPQEGARSLYRAISNQLADNL